MSWLFFLIGIVLFVLGAGGIKAIRDRQADEEVTITWKAVAWFFGLGLLACAIGADNLPLSEEEIAARAAEEAACRRDLACWSKKHFSSAKFACKRALEARAKYGFEWTDGDYGDHVDHRLTQWQDQEHGHIRYIGDQLRLQNVFGTFQTVFHRCDYDTKNKRVLRVRIVTPEEGVLKLYADP